MTFPQAQPMDRLPLEICAAAARGWRLLPIRAHDKTPLVKGWPQLATSETRQLEAWAAQFPACNWGVATGAESGVFVLDVDGSPGKASLKAYRQRGLELPETLTVATGKGGHLYFQWPNEAIIKNSAGQLAKGLDIRVSGGCAVIPPSVHSSGKRYVYVNANAPIAHPPQWLLTLLAESAQRPRLISPQPQGAIPEGRRNDTLTSLAGSMRHRGMTKEAIEAELLEENRQQCQPPLPVAEVRGIAASVARYAPSQPEGGQVRRPVLVCLSDVESKPVDWLWEPYLPKGMLALLSGDPGGGKTFLSLAIAAALSNGRTPYSLEAREPVNTLYLSLENSAEHVVRPRFDSLRGDCSRFQLLQGSITGGDQPNGAISLSDTDLLEKAITESQAGLLIVDPIQSYLGADVDAHRSNETRPILDGLGQLASRHNCCVLLVRHLSKSSGGRAIHRGLGSIDITGAARTELMAGTAPNEPNSRALVQVKNNLGPYGDSLGFTIGEDGFAWTGKSDLTSGDLLASDSDTETRTDISCALDFLKNELASGPKLQKELVSQSGLSERTMQRAARKLSLKKQRDGEHGPWLWSLG
ncbi:MAG TPA: bifunctional DNA primase/polymerase [Terracidiphilus sp.]